MRSGRLCSSSLNLSKVKKPELPKFHSAQQKLLNSDVRKLKEMSGKVFNKPVGMYFTHAHFSAFTLLVHRHAINELLVVDAELRSGLTCSLCGTRAPVLDCEIYVTARHVSQNLMRRQLTRPKS